MSSGSVVGAVLGLPPVPATPLAGSPLGLVPKLRVPTQKLYEVFHQVMLVPAMPDVTVRQTATRQNNL